MANSPAVQRLFNSVTSRLPGILDSQVQDEFFETIDELFTETNAWKEEVPFETITDVTNYDVIPTGNAKTLRLMWVVNDEGRPIVGTMATPGCLVLGKKPSQDGLTYNASIALSITDPTDRDNLPVFPSWVLDKYRAYIFEGLVGRLMSQPAKPYTNQTMSVYHLRRWRNAMVKIRTEAAQMNLFGGQAWAFPQQFRTTRRRG